VRLRTGVLDELRRISIGCTNPGTCDRTLLDEVDVISSTSGGSFTAAYYRLNRDEIFDPGPSPPWRWNWCPSSTACHHYAANSRSFAPRCCGFARTNP